MTEIELPDGRVIELSGNESPEQLSALKQKLKQKYKVKESVPEQGGLINRVLQRGGEVKNLQKQRMAGEITRPEEIYRVAGQGAGAISDVAGAALSSALSGANYLTGGKLGQAADTLGQGIASLPIPFDERNIGDFASDILRSGAQQYGEFKEENPRTAGMIEATGNLATVLPSFAKYADDVARGITKTGKAMQKPPVLPSETVRQQASALYQRADEIGGKLKPEFTQKFGQKLARLGQKDEFITKIRRKAGQDDAYANVLDVLNDYVDEPLSFDRAKALDETLGSLAYSNLDNTGKLDDVGRQYLDMQTTLRDMVNSATPDDFIGSGEAFEIAKEARKYWTAQNKLRDIERIIENAERMDVPATSVRTGFRTLLRNGKRLKGYSPKEVKALEKAARTGITTDALRLAGSGLGPIVTGSIAGASTMNPVIGMAAAAPAFALQNTAKAAATARQMSRAKDVGRIVTQGLTGAPQSSVFVEGARVALPLSQALTPAAIAGLTKEELSYIMSLPPQEAKRILGAQ